MAAVVSSLSASALAQTHTWNGNGTNSNWSTGANWLSGLAPTSSFLNTILFQGSNRQSNVNNLGTFDIGTLTLNGSGWFLSGNDFRFRGGGTINSFGTSNTIANNVQLTANGLNFTTNAVMNAGQNLTMTGNISGPGILRKQGAGILTLSGANTFSLLDIAAGTVNTNESSLVNQVIANGTLVHNVTGNHSYGGNIAGYGSVRKTGAGIWILNGSRSDEWNLVINGGKVSTHAGMLGYGVQMDSLSATELIINQNTNGSFGGGISAVQNNHIFRKQGTGSVNYADDISANIAVIVEGGRLNLVRQGLTNVMSVASGATLGITTSSTTPITLTSAISGAGNVAINGNGELNWLTNQTNLTGSVLIESGTVKSNSSVMSKSTNIAAAGTLVLDDSAGAIFGNLSGAGKVVKAGSGLLRLLTSSNWTGDLILADGSGNVILEGAGQARVDGNTQQTVLLKNHNYSGFYVTGNVNLETATGVNVVKNALNNYTGNTVAAAGSTLVMTTDSVSERIQGAGTFQFDQDFHGQYAGILTGSLGFTKSGTGIVTLDGADVNGYTGTVRVLGGGLKLKDTNFGQGVAIYNSGTLTVDNSSNQTWMNRLVTNNLFVKDGSGTLGFDGFRMPGGNMRVDRGTVLAKEGGLSGVNNVTIGQAGRLKLNGGESFVQTDTLTNNGQVAGSGRIDAEFTNGTTGTVAVGASDVLISQGQMMNQGIVQLTGGAFQTGETLTNMATGQISGRGTLRAGTETGGGLGLYNQGSVAFSGGFSDVFGDVINAAGGRIMSVGGSVATFHDDVVHNGAEIRTAAGSRSVFLGNLSGAGSFTGTGTVEVQGDLRPGNSPAHVSFEGDLVLGSTATTNIELGGLVMGTQYDSISVDGTAFLDGALDVDQINGFQASLGNRFQLFSGQLSGTFDAIYLPTLNSGLYWNTSRLYQDGCLEVVPEPASLGLLTLSFFGLLRRRKR